MSWSRSLRAESKRLDWCQNSATRSRCANENVLLPLGKVGVTIRELEHSGGEATEIMSDTIPLSSLARRLGRQGSLQTVGKEGLDQYTQPY
jgi:hypothetical protein